MIADTNALSDFFDGVEAVVGKMASVDALHLPVSVLGEYRFGLLGSRKRAEREARFREFAARCQVLPILESTTGYYAAIRQELRRAGTPIPGNDVWIAALAREHKLPVLSADTHFDAVSGLQRISW